jgi:hypothetical protein
MLRALTASQRRPADCVVSAALPGRTTACAPLRITGTISPQRIYLLVGVELLKDVALFSDVEAARRTQKAQERATVGRPVSEHGSVDRWRQLRLQRQKPLT